MELRQLKYFLAVADSCSFVSAAQKQFVSRQAISKSIAQLEEELNVELFTRDSGGAFLTPAGVMFYERVRTLVTELDSVYNRMRSYGNRYQQRIRIAFSIGTISLLEQQLNDYWEKQYNLELSYEENTEEACRQMLLEHKADMVVSTAPIHDPLFETELLLQSPFGILIRETRELQEVDVKDLNWVPLAGYSDSQTTAFCERSGVNLRFRGYDTQRLVELTRQGKCALVIPACLVPKQCEGMRWIPVVQGGMWQLYMSYPGNVRKNLMFSDVLEDLRQQVFAPLMAIREETK